MKTRDEIIEYLGLEFDELFMTKEELEDNKKIIEYALSLEETYEQAIKEEKIGYCLAGDFETRKLEPDIFELKYRYENNGIIIYEKILNRDKIIEEARYYHYNDCSEELEFYEYLASIDKRIKILVDEATKEVCEWFGLPYEEYIKGNIEWGEDTDYSEFLLELVNNIAEWLGIDNH